MMHGPAWHPVMFAGLALIPALTLSAAPALAQSADAEADVPRLTVGYGDLDLSTAKGRARLDLRLKRAAADVCGRNDSDRLQLSYEAAVRHCTDTALRQARTAMAARLDTRMVDNR